MIRRVHTPLLRPGEIELDAPAARHVRSVLRLTKGTAVEVFDDDGAVAAGKIIQLEPAVVIRVTDITAVPRSREIVIASAVPKGERADWMIEKLSELGCSRFIPLATARSVVHPEGKNKRERWARIAVESAKQSRRRGVMRIDDLTPLKAAIESAATEGTAYYLTTEPGAESILDAAAAQVTLTLFIGPEGGWTEEELSFFARSNARGLTLTDTVLRVETAAVAAATVAAVLASKRASAPSNRDGPI
ncbi:MAG: RsmE family RNA methyltransferase [Tepidisphaeraceae bacterium]